ncbi:MAG: TPM domain-containing protein [Bacteroidetes bacterium]|nr:TPM domain-containing protein [Bacteroidota bacterium]
MLRPILAALIAAFLFVLSARADVNVPHLTTRVYDETSTLTPDQVEALSRKLAIYEDSTSTQIVVVIVKTLGGAEINDYATTLGKQNAVGQSKKNNGVILLIAMQEHKTYIATGYGMEPTVTDALASVILRDVLKPALRNGDFYGGINATIDSIAAAAKGEFKGTGSHRGKRNSDDSGPMGLVIVVIIFIIIAVIRGAIGTGLRRTVVGSQGANHGFMSGFLSALFWSSIFRGGGRRGGDGWGGFGGGGSDGGGFSGFSGGGGDFGGGGAGGDW